MKRIWKSAALLGAGILLGLALAWFLLSRAAALALLRRGGEAEPASGEVWTLNAADGVTLRAYAVRTGAGERWALLLHGWGGSAGELEALGEAYRAEGWSTLIPDLRGCGLSGGERQGLGLGDREDVLLWLRRIDEAAPGAETALHGVGTGACAALCAAGVRPEGLCAVVAEGAFTSLRDLGEAALETWSGEAHPLLLGGAGAVTALYTGFTWREACLRTQAAGTRVPILFLQGEGDGLVPADMGETLCRCAVRGSRVKTLPGRTGEGQYLDREAYLEELFGFLTGCSAGFPAP